MSRFILKFKLRGRANRDKPDRIVDRGEVVLGSRPLADVFVADRLVSQEEIVFHFDGAHLALEVKGKLSGVFVDGHPVDGRGSLRSGATVQVGHSLVECAIDAAKAECTLTTNEQYLPQVVDGIVMKTKPSRPFALVDPGPQEHRWGKTPYLRRANWIAGVAGVLLLAAFPFVKDTEAMTRGELHHAHAIGARDGPKDCAACHAPLSSDYNAKCAECHKGFDAPATHPYALNAGLRCNECHAEHVGADADIMPPMGKTSMGWPRTCAGCHEELTVAYPSGDVPGEVVAIAKTRLRDERGAPFARHLLIDGFSHADHRVARTGGIAGVPGGPPQKGQVPVACADCHKPLAKGAVNPVIATAEFEVVAYDKCLECHADWRVAIHGRDQEGAACYACHAKAESPSKITADLRTVELPATESKWVLKPRNHDFKKDECLACHVLEKSSAGKRTPIGEKVFRHDHHLRTVSPSPGAERALAADCKACHEDVAGSSSLAGTRLVNTAVCATCHVDSEPTPVPVKEGATRRVGDMFHKVHTLDSASLTRSALRYASLDTLSKGCLSCHTPAAGEAPMGFREGAKDCKACHTGHESVGEGKCVLCHVDRAPGKNREINGRLEFRFNEPGIFNPEKALKKSAAAIGPFDHASAGHAKSECAGCHREEHADRATRVLDVAWPAFDEDSCVKCHVRERFHR